MKALALALVVTATTLTAACDGDGDRSLASLRPTQSPPTTPTPRGCPVTGEPAEGLGSGLFLDDGTYEFSLGQLIQITLTIANCGDSSETRFYPDSQRYDFIVSEAAGDELGDEVWRWSTDKVFAEILGEETFEPRETVTHSEIWSQVDSSGRQLPAGRYHILGIDVGCEDQELTLCHFGPGVYFDIVP